MWTRSTWHECANELDIVCSNFRRAYWGRRSKSWPRHPEDIKEMEETSRQGVTILRSLALAVRSEQDFNLLPDVKSVVGVLIEQSVSPSELIKLKQSIGHKLESKGKPLHLRQALNKIAHSNPQRSDFLVKPFDSAHFLFLFGEHRGQEWLAVISLFAFVEAIRSLPDVALESSH